MFYSHALDQLSRHNVNLASLDDENLEGLVYGKGVATSTLISMHEAATTLRRSKLYREIVTPLATETTAALNLKALHGDTVAREYLAGLSAKK
jgi:hypothetical protein